MATTIGGERNGESQVGGEPAPGRPQSRKEMQANRGPVEEPGISQRTHAEDRKERAGEEEFGQMMELWKDLRVRVISGSDYGTETIRIFGDYPSSHTCLF